MKIYKYEFRVDTGNQHDYYKFSIENSKYFSENTKENRDKFIKIVGKESKEFSDGASSDWFGYKIIGIDVD